jgi:hypothetical protein
MPEGGRRQAEGRIEEAEGRWYGDRGQQAERNVSGRRRESMYACLAGLVWIGMDRPKCRSSFRAWLTLEGCGGSVASLQVWRHSRPDQFNLIILITIHHHRHLLHLSHLFIATMSKSVRQLTSLVCRARASSLHPPPSLRRPAQCRCYVSATKPAKAAAIPLKVSSDQAPSLRPSGLDDVAVSLPAAPEGPAAGAWPMDPPRTDANLNQPFCT